MWFLLSILSNDPGISHLCNISNQHVPSAVLDPKHSLILNIASNSYSQVTHSMGQPPNPALLIGLQFTPVSSICFCLQRATVYSRARAGKTNRFTRKSRKFTQRSCPAVCWCLLVKGKAGVASGTLQMGGGHLQGAVRCKPPDRHCACLILLSLRLSGVSVRTQVWQHKQTWASPPRRGEGRTPQSTGSFSVRAPVSPAPRRWHLTVEFAIVLKRWIADFPQKTLRANTSPLFTTFPSMPAKRRWADSNGFFVFMCIFHTNCSLHHRVFWWSDSLLGTIGAGF